MNDRTPDGTSALTWLLCFVAGGVTGASVALLLAPQSGRATRELMRRKLGDTVQSARDFREHVVDRGQKIGDEARLRVKGAVSALAGDGGAKLPL